MLVTPPPDRNKILLLITPLLVVDALLLASTHAWAYLQSVELSRAFELSHGIVFFPFLFLSSLLAVSLIESIWHVRKFTRDESGQVNLQVLLTSGIFKLDLPVGIAVPVLMGFGVVACANMAEIYRLTTVDWHDGSLWQIEEPLFGVLLGSWLNVPLVWDRVYFLIWPFVFMAMALVYKKSGEQRFMLIVLAVVIAFFLTRCINLLFPTAGPAFYQPKLFYLEGTASDFVQAGLRLYMAGHIPQNGLMPGTMAMPSLHVGLVAMAAWFLACEWRWTRWLTLPWVLLVWLSTIMLGWHYALDGVGGVLVVGLAIAAAKFILQGWNALIRVGPANSLL
jgi:membrane-associated phospholipid phosphatase